MDLSVASRVDYLAVARHYATTPASWPLEPRFNPGHHWGFRLARHDDHEVWLMTWLPGQGTDLHDHGGSDSAFVVVEGDLTEYTVSIGPDPVDNTTGVRVASSSIGVDCGRHRAPHHLHRIANDGYRPAVSVHVYGPALAEMTRYQIGAGGIRAIGVDRAGSRW